MDGGELVAAGAAALVQAMTTEGWEAVRRRVAALFGRGHQAAEAELDRTREELTGGETTVEEAAAEWRTKLRRLLKHHPQAAEELQALLTDLAPARGAVSNTITGNVSGTAVQAHTISGGITTTYHGDHVDQRGARAGRDVIGTQHHHHGGRGGQH
ncbi:hypothetical protein NI17_024000 (plasmid) [Thermobifida halotolerans]|uniref:Uncharacterized protein n=1 Tax=Thermobifida halotolerans TaxID=483545 RepID=A0A399FTC6_9ACTN|nr:hypothetical protein [Thermobifida halotolerans]UOE22278.1 hypothetical protein NI17_024000 [Thermobifida halotolerans]